VLVNVKAAVRDDDPRVDLATLTLESDLPLTAFASEDNGRKPIAGVVRAVGFGAVDPDGRLGFGRKKARDLVVPSSLGCNRQAALRTGCRPGLEMLIENTGANDACSGDSGGPLFIQDADSPTGWRLIAITSRAVGNARRACGAGGIFVSISEKRGER
jgi:hypothetical protein